MLSVCPSVGQDRRPSILSMTLLYHSVFKRELVRGLVVKREGVGVVLVQFLIVYVRVVRSTLDDRE